MLHTLLIIVGVIAASALLFVLALLVEIAFHRRVRVELGHPKETP